MIKKLLLALVVLVSLYALREGWFYFLERQKLPFGTTIGGVPVEFMTLEEAGEAVATAFGQPVVLSNEVNGERIELAPSDLSFELDLSTMLQQAEAEKDAMEWWVGYVGYLLDRPIAPITIELLATHNPAQVDEVAELAADLMAEPVKPPRLEPRTLRFLPGESGYEPDTIITAQRITAALYSPSNREATMVLNFAEAPELDYTILQTIVENHLNVAGLATIGFIVDLQTGEEISVNGDAAVSGLSIMKIPILIEVFRKIDGQPNFDQQKLLNQMIIESSNLAANLLLDVVAGQDNAYLGSDILTESMQRLGVENTYIVTPYEEPPRPSKPLLRTAANTVDELLTKPEESMQTTAEDIGTLLVMIYDCANGGGALLALYPDQLDSTECQAMIDLLMLNVEGTWMIRDGMPKGTTVAHKHGYGFDIHGDAGLVFSEGGDYVIVTYVSDPGVDWLVSELSFPIMRELSRIVYNYYNPENPHLDFREYEIEAALAAGIIDEEEAAKWIDISATELLSASTPITTSVPLTDTVPASGE